MTPLAGRSSSTDPLSADPSSGSGSVVPERLPITSPNWVTFVPSVEGSVPNMISTPSRIPSPSVSGSTGEVSYWITSCPSRSPSLSVSGSVKFVSPRRSAMLVNPSTSISPLFFITITSPDATRRTSLSFPGGRTVRSTAYRPGSEPGHWSRSNWTETVSAALR